MKEIKVLLDSFKGEIYNFCYEVLKDSDDEEVVFEFLCKNFRKRQNEETYEIEEYFSKNEIEETELAYGDIVNGLLNGTIKKCNAGLIKPEDFYKALWCAYCLNFTTIKEKAFATYFTIIDSTIPYQYLGKPVSMSNDRFREILKNNEAVIEKINYIKRSNYTQRTEQTSLLLNCLESIHDFESKSVILAYAIKEFSSKLDIDGLLKQMDKR